MGGMTSYMCRQYGGANYMAARPASHTALSNEHGPDGVVALVLEDAALSRNLKTPSPCT